MTSRVFQILLVFVVVSFAASKSFSDEYVHQQIMKLLSLPQKSEKMPNANVFKVRIGDKILTGAFKWDNCNSSAPLKMNTLSISPDPIKLSGDITVAVNGTVGLDLTEDLGLSVKLVIKKKIAGIEIEIPCEDNIGSCTYSDICSLIPVTPPADCPDPLPQYKIPCSCPINKGFYNLPASTFAIPPVPLPGWLASGDYQIGAKAFDKAGTNLACYDFKITLA